MDDPTEKKRKKSHADEPSCADKNKVKRNNSVNWERRRFLTTLTSAAAGVGVLFALVPFIAAFRPSQRAQAAGAPVSINLSSLEEGQQVTVEWRGQPIWIVRRSQTMLASLPGLTDELRDPDSLEPQQPAYTQNTNRSIKPEYFIAVGLCTHLGCVPTYRPDIGGINSDWPGGFYCPCHGSMFDLAGRVYRGVPAPLNLEIPPHRYVSDEVVVIGEDEDMVA